MSRYLLALAGAILVCVQTAQAQPGYRPNDGRQSGHYDDRSYAPGYARTYHDCQRDQGNRQATNAAIGAAAGGLLGNQVAGRGDRTGGTIAGVLLGAVAGYALTKDMNCNDRGYAEPTYYQGLQGPVGRPYNWRNDQSRDYGSFTPTREYNRGGYTCRDWNATNYRDGRPTRRSGSACRYEDGNWYFQ